MNDLGRRLAVLEARVNELADRDAIRELSASYCRAVVSGDVEGVVDLFCPDGTFETDAIASLDRPAGSISGHDEIRAQYGAMVSAISPKPFIHNQIVEVEADGRRARGFCSVEIRTIQDGVAYDVAGHYEDVYQKIADRWKFERRRFVVYSWVRSSQG